MEMEKKKQISTTYTPSDIIVRILSWFPAKSLLRLRWTCKYWFDLITRDPYFRKMHIHYSCFSRYSSVLTTSSYRTTDYRELRHCHLTDTKGYLSGQVRIHDPFESPANFRLLATCHGLLFFLSKAHLRFCIWNPCTKEYKLLPPPPPPHRIVNRYIHKARHIYGVGYDSSIDDYKVIKNSYFYEDINLQDDENDVHNFIGSSVQVYRLGTNTWTTIGPNPYNLLPCNNYMKYYSTSAFVNGCLYSKDSMESKDYDCGGQVYNYQQGGVFVNGAIYWMDFSDNNRKIISFDLAKETYQELSKKPEYFHLNSQILGMRLQLFEGSLCLVLKVLGITSRCFMEMWVMKDDRANNSNQEPSWTKLFEIVQTYEPCMVLKPLRFTNNGEILFLKNWTDFVLCDPKKSEITTLISIGCKEGNYALVLEVYNESFVSLNSGTYVGQKQKEKKKFEEDNQERTEIKEQMKKKMKLDDDDVHIEENNLI